MKRVLLLLVGVVLVAALVLAPPPSDEEQFVHGLGQTVVPAADATPLAFEPLDAGGKLEAEEPLRVSFAAAEITGFEETTPEMLAAVEDCLDRALKTVNREAAEVERVALEDNPDAILTLHIAPFVDGRKNGLRAEARYQAPGGGALEGVEPAEAEFIYPNRTSLLPPLLAILLAIAFRRVLIALFGGVWLAGILLSYQNKMSSPWGEWLTASWTGGDRTANEPSIVTAIGEGFMRTFDVILRSQLVDSFRIEIIGFTVFLVASVGVMSRSGGMAGLVNSITGIARGVRTSQFATWLMGVVIFFDDYANCIVVGNSMRPLTDRLRIAREKLAYIVDSTAAPVAAVCVLSTWIAFEVSTFSSQLPPEVGGPAKAYDIFFMTLPFRYYAWFTLAFVLMTILLQRDFGPMLRAEQRARRTGQLLRPGARPLVSETLTAIEAKSNIEPRARRAVLPILAVITVTLSRIWSTGVASLVESGRAGIGHPWTLGSSSWYRLDQIGSWVWPTWEQTRDVIGQGAGSEAILYGAFTGLVAAMFLAMALPGKIALVSGWWAAARITPTLGHHFTEITARWSSSAWTIENATEGALPPVSERASGFVQSTVDGMSGSFSYLAFLVAFLAVSSTVGLIASAVLGNDEDEGQTGNGRLTAEEGLRAALASTRAMGMAIVILFLAWMIGKACVEMGTADYLVAQMGSQLGSVSWLLPIVLFLVSCVVSFSTGSSWSTMGILLPVVVGLAYSVGEAAEGITGLLLMVLSIGAVLEGSIFGDHCSPISDTTVLSSTACASDHIDHVRTQMPYAVVVMIVALTVGYLPQGLQWWSPGVSLGLGIGILFMILLIFGRNPGSQAAEEEDRDTWSPLPDGAEGGARIPSNPLDESAGPESGPPWVSKP